MEESGDNKKKEIDLMEKFNNPCNYDEKSLYDICKKEAERTIEAVMSTLTDNKKYYSSSLWFVKTNFQQIRIDIYKMYNISLTEEEYDEKNIENIAHSILIKFNNLLEKEKNFENKLINFISFKYVVKISDDVINNIAEILKDYYKIEKGNDEKYHVISQHNIEIRTWAEQRQSLQSVMKYYYQNDIKKALGELRKITEFNNPKNKKFKNFVLKQPNELIEMCKKVYDFITKCENHNDGFENATINEQRIWLDLGLSIYRLFLMSDEK